MKVLVMLFAMSIAITDEGSWVKDMEKMARGVCSDFPSTFEHIGQVNPSLVMFVCRLSSFHALDLRIHSGKRLSKHHYGNALDFRFNHPDYTNRCSVYKFYKNTYQILQSWLENHEIIDHVGIGLYPDQNTPFFHLDFRGKKARWSRIDGQYLAIAEGERLIDTKLGECNN